MEQLSATFVQRVVRSLTRATWKRLARISCLFFVLGFIVLFVFHFRLYEASVQEENFDQTIQCYVEQIGNNTRTCEFSRQAHQCQLINGICSDGRNLTLFLTWFDFDNANGQCTIDPCSSSSTAVYAMDQTLVKVFASATSTHAYLELTAKLNLKTAKIIFYILIVFTILTFLLSICFIFVLHSYKNYHKLVHPLLSYSSSENISTYKRPPSIIVHRTQRMDNTTTLQNNSVVVPIEITPTIPPTLNQTLDPTSLPIDTQTR